MKRLAVFIGFALVAILHPLTALGQQYEWNDVSRVVAVGDVHGAYDNLVKVLQNAELIDDKLNWIGGDAHLVQNGDLVDRGPESRKVMDFLMKLEDRAEDKGGRVHLLIGNHEAMNIVGILDLVSKEEYEAFIDRDSRKRHEQAFERYYDDLRRETREKGERAPTKNAARNDFTEKYPIGYIEHRRAFDADGRYGKWIRSHNTSVLINGVLFSHGDWSEKFAEIGIAEVNDRVRKELAGELEINDGLTFDEASPLQYRGLANVSLNAITQQHEQPRVDRILERLGASRMVVGHTLTPGWIESRYEGKHVSIDVGMLEIYRGGHRIALELEGDAMRAIHDGGKVDVPTDLNEENLAEYTALVAAVDPENLDAQLSLVDTMLGSGREAEAMPLVEKLFETSEYVPFRYRDILGAHYEARGDIAAAREQYLAYVDGIAVLVERNAENTNLANLLARYCVDKGIELDRALRAITAALDHAPDNYGFLVTKARVHLAQGSYPEALGLLESATPPAGFEYDTYLHTGSAHAGLGDTELARTWYDKAIELEPERAEARDARSRLGTQR